ncbi:MAG: DUF2079 domain-containing protein [Ruminococcaceae bacterium]|nr:DUF2079 domain-containing protein [Oscillospiraceae bacterium]
MKRRNKMIKKITNFFDKNTREDFFIRLFSAWSIMGIINYFKNPVHVEKIESVISTDLFTSVLYFLIAYILITAASLALKKFDTDGWIFAVSTLSYLTIVSTFSANQYYCLALIFAAMLSVVYCVKRFTAKKNVIEPGKRFTAAMSVTVAVIATFIIGLIGVSRYLCFSTPNFDFGIFSQMFYYMKTQFVPLTTCERQKLLSHFAVHLSPVYYLLLPVYFIFPSPITLQVSQAVILGSALIPLFLIARHYKLSNKCTILLMVAASFYPAMAGGTMYDIHENAFLLPLILWTLYFAEKNKNIPMYIFVALTFSVKEDAAIYIAFIALYFILSGRKKLHGTVMLLSSIGYFSFAVAFLKKFGEGAMTGRFDNFITDESLGLVDVIITIFKNPAYFVSQCMSAEKLLFVLFMFLPLGFSPLLSKKWSQFILIGPLVLINLMSDYQYQHSIYFQYVYGTMAVLFYLAVINIAQAPQNIKKYISPMAAVFSVIMFAFSVSPKFNYVERLEVNKQDYVRIREALDTIEDDASVLSTTFYIPYLSQRDEIYEIEYAMEETDYIVIDTRFDSAHEQRLKIDMSKYKLVVCEENLVEIYAKIK